MVRYERPSLASRCLPFFMGLRRPFKPRIVRLLAAALFWIVTFGWMVVCGYIAAIRYPKNKATLPDILFDVLPERRLHPLPDILLYLLLTSVVGRIIFHSDGVAIARRFAAISGCTYFLRGFTLLATSFPSSTVECMDQSFSWSLRGSILGTCEDMTGRTVNLALAALCWSQYTKHIIVQILAWGVALSGMMTLLISRSNYTIDVLISFFLSFFIWKYYHLALAVPSGRNRIVRWLEKLDFGAAAEDSGVQLAISPASRYKGLTESLSTPLGSPLSSPSVPSRFIELTESLGGSSAGPTYKELRHQVD